MKRYRGETQPLREWEARARVRPELPDELDDRAQGIWEVLLAIADVAGEDWPERARQAARALSAARSAKTTR